MPKSRSASQPKHTSSSARRILGAPPAEATQELAALYGKGKKVKLTVHSTSYSNLAFVQVSPRDVFIDFLQAPGAPQGDEVVVEATRIYLSLPAAKSLSDVMTQLIDKARKAGQIEKLE